jgi:glyoxylase-like metal-dependent hydrolase (beta-lactamase superfamily II)
VLPPKLAAHFTITPCRIDIPLHHNQLLTPELRIIHLEGHTAGNICLLFKDEVLLAGDSIMGKNLLNPAMGPDEINPPLSNASMDQEKALANLKKLLDYTFSVILPSHGEPIKENARQKLEQLIAKAA